MKNELFQELLASVREAGAVMRGERKARRERRLELPDVKAILKELRLSEAQFARLLNVRETTVRNWQQGKTQAGWRQLRAVARGGEAPRGVA